jgi:hypothetical protein
MTAQVTQVNTYLLHHYEIKEKCLQGYLAPLFFVLFPSHRYGYDDDDDNDNTLFVPAKPRITNWL